MQIHNSRYLQSTAAPEKCPPPTMPEFAFIGRSNVGKSSLINFLTNRKNLALTSKKPGKTKSINHFVIDDAWYLVDLPGYGFAKIGQEQREQWLKMTKVYLRKRENLINVFLLIDASIPPQLIDLEFTNWLGENQIPFSIVFTKADKEKEAIIDQNIDLFKTKLLEEWEELPKMFKTSSEKDLGRDELLKYIKWCILQFKKPKAV